jgi:hypothetical protein
MQISPVLAASWLLKMLMEWRGIFDNKTNRREYTAIDDNEMRTE